MAGCARDGEGQGSADNQEDSDDEDGWDYTGKIRVAIRAIIYSNIFVNKFNDAVCGSKYILVNSLSVNAIMHLSNGVR